MNLLQPFRLERYFARHEFTAKYLLSSSDCESRTIEELLRLEPSAAAGLQRLWLGYTESLGSPALRREICRLYSAISVDQLLVHAGAEEAILLFMNALMENGDEIIVHSPGYQALAEIPRAMGCHVVPWTAREDRGWELDLSELESKITRKTKCIVVNLPHNPTGFLPSREFFLELNRIAESRGIVLFSDEVYRESEHDAGDRLPAACDVSEKAVSLGVLSKTYGLPGLRIGWVATRNRRVLARMAELKDYTTICNSAPSEFLAEVALRHRESLAKRSLQIIHENLALLDGFFARHSGVFRWSRPQAGPVAFPRLVTAESDSFCGRAAERAGIMLLPGSVFGDYRHHFRVGFGRKNLPDALLQLEAFMRSGFASDGGRGL